jgi:ankyrin repeat protein
MDWGRTKVVQMLLDRGAKWDARMFNRAVGRGDQEGIKAFVARGASLNAPDEDGQLPLVTAAPARSSVQTMRFLLAAGASPDGRNKQELTPLMAIIKSQSYEGPSVSKEGRGGRRWQNITSRIDPKRPNDLPSALPAVSLLLSAGADLDAVDAEGMTALHYAATSDYNLPIVALLAAYGAKINAPDRFGRTPLDYAIELGLERVPPELTSHGGRTGAELKQR